MTLIGVALLVMVGLGFAGLMYVLNTHLEEMHDEISAARQLSLLRNIADEIQTTRIALSGALGAINHTVATSNARIDAERADVLRKQH